MSANSERQPNQSVAVPPTIVPATPPAPAIVANSASARPRSAPEKRTKTRDIAAAPAIAHVVEPDADLAARFAPRLARYRDLYRNLSALFGVA